LNLNASPSQLVRAAAVGLGAGLFLGGAALMAMGARSVWFEIPCDRLSSEECAVERELAISWARWQSLWGLGLLLLALAVFLYVRTVNRQPRETELR
jgi:hypothetical protein